VTAILEALEHVCVALTDVEPRSLTTRDCERAMDLLGRVRKLVETSQARIAAEAQRRDLPRTRGYAHATDWMAADSGGTIRLARKQLETVGQVHALTATNDALTAGDISVAQAAEILKTAAIVPEAEGELLAVAAGGTLGAVMDRGRKRRLAAMDPERRSREQRANRSVAHGIDDLGMVAGHFRLPPVVGARFTNRLDRETDRIFREARAAGEHRTRAQCAADAFVALTNGSAKTTPGRVDLVVVVDVNAWRRGHAHGGELCHAVGVGPITLDDARLFADDAFLKVAFHDGTQIDRIKHFGRHIPAELRTALDLGSLPELDGATCSRPGCERRYGIQWHHVDAFSNGGATSRANLRGECDLHHEEETQRQRAAGVFRKRPPPEPG
jgi:hypothetical protein